MFQIVEECMFDQTDKSVHPRMVVEDDTFFSEDADDCGFVHVVDGQEFTQDDCMNRMEVFYCAGGEQCQSKGDVIGGESFLYHDTTKNYCAMAKHAGVIGDDESGFFGIIRTVRTRGDIRQGYRGCESNGVVSKVWWICDWVCDFDVQFTNDAFSLITFSLTIQGFHPVHWLLFMSPKALLTQTTTVHQFC
eukprot:TRINITY_DN1302_c0_g2_i2.p1 TRINITY_DN1302_c0_g2~~TRINITY_DN1302_c0_g2_i2.p1  ORF type:complete len:219 (-),score=34.93 TRINITY_DN1302_c0_g2_i2:24-596(-)